MKRRRFLQILAANSVQPRATISSRSSPTRSRSAFCTRCPTGSPSHRAKAARGIATAPARPARMTRLRMAQCAAESDTVMISAA